MLCTAIQETTSQEKKRFTPTRLQISLYNLPMFNIHFPSHFALLFHAFSMNTGSPHKRTMLVVLGLLSIFLVFRNSHAYQFKVGGSGDWSLASSSSYDQWAQQSRFQTGDTLRKFQAFKHLFSFI